VFRFSPAFSSRNGCGLKTCFVDFCPPHAFLRGRSVRSWNVLSFRHLFHLPFFCRTVSPCYAMRSSRLCVSLSREFHALLLPFSLFSFRVESAPFLSGAWFGLLAVSRLITVRSEHFDVHGATAFSPASFFFGSVGLRGNTPIFPCAPLPVTLALFFSSVIPAFRCLGPSSSEFLRFGAPAALFPFAHRVV